LIVFIFFDLDFSASSAFDSSSVSSAFDSSSAAETASDSFF